MHQVTEELMLELRLTHRWREPRLNLTGVRGMEFWQDLTLDTRHLTGVGGTECWQDLTLDTRHLTGVLAGPTTFPRCPTPWSWSRRP
jgi:hypothetical protein